MKMSTKGRYAVMAMIDIAAHSDGEPVSLGGNRASGRTSARNIWSSSSASCGKHKLVESARGPGGGYRLARAMNMIPVAEIIAAVDEELHFTRCGGDAVEGCVKGERCNAHDLWSSLGRQMMYFLSSISLEDVVEKRNLALAATIKQTKDRHPDQRPAA